MHCARIPASMMDEARYLCLSTVLKFKYRPFSRLLPFLEGTMHGTVASGQTMRTTFGNTLR